MTLRRAAALALVLSAVSCPAKPPPEPKLKTVVLITLDTTRADRLGAYGRKDSVTPAIDRLAAEGVRLSRCLTTAPITLPAHASILSGTDPIAHGARVNGEAHFADDNPSIAATLHDAGFATAAFVSAPVLDRRYGLDLGFDHYDDHRDPDREERLGEPTVEAALAHVRGLGAPRLFLWVHLFDAHAPYAAPQAFAAKIADPYDAELAYVDSCVDRLLAGLKQMGRLDDAAVAIVADHGEGLGDHGESTHTIFVYDATLRVPCIVWSPSLLKPCVVDGTASTIMLAPTLLDLAGVPAPEAMYGTSLADAMRARAPVPSDRRVAYFESQATEYYYGFAPLAGFERDGRKLIVAPRSELYSPLRDPGELNDEFDREQNAARQLKRDLDQWVRAHSTPRSAPPAPSEAVAAHLEEIGYGQRRVADGRQDPKDGIALIEALIAAAARMDTDVTEARRQLEKLATEHPDVAEVHETLGDACWKQRDMAAALNAYRAAEKHRASDPALLVKQARCIANLPDADLAAARRLLRLALDIDGENVGAMMWLGLLANGEGNLEEARTWYRKVLGLQPDHAQARQYLAQLPP